MTKSEMMKKYEAETGKEAIDYLTEYPFDDYTRWLETKASAYDRMMSGGKKTIQEYIAKYWDKQVIDFAVRLDGEDSFYIHPALESGDTLNFKAHGNCLETIWGYTLPDGWEEAK